ncbi:hypothetical protein BN1708_019128, partial [Verticillium longisporum]
PGAQG